MTLETSAPANNLQIFLFGKLRCHFGGRPAGSIEAAKAQELLCLLALGLGREHHRDLLADRLWEEDRTDAKKGLRQALWQLQSALAPVSAATGVACLVAGGDWIGFNTQANVWVDAVALETTYLRYRQRCEAELTREQVRELQAAADSYQGDLLEGCYLDFCIQEREHYRFRYLSLLDKLLGYYEWQRDYERCVDCARRILRCEPARESTHRRLMLLHYLAGDRVRALRQFELCTAALARDLGVTPDHATVELHEMIGHDDRALLWALAPPAGDMEAAPAPAPPAPPPSPVGGQLEMIRQAVAKLQADVSSLYAALEGAAMALSADGSADDADAVSAHVTLVT